MNAVNRQVVICPSFCIAKVKDGVCLYQQYFGKCLEPRFRRRIEAET